MDALPRTLARLAFRLGSCSDDFAQVTVKPCRKSTNMSDLARHVLTGILFAVQSPYAPQISTEPVALHLHLFSAAAQQLGPHFGLNVILFEELLCRHYRPVLQVMPLPLPAPAAPFCGSLPSRHQHLSSRRLTSRWRHRPRRRRQKTLPLRGACVPRRLRVRC